MNPTPLPPSIRHAAAAMLASLLLAAGVSAADVPVEPAMPGDAFPDFTLPVLQGGELSLSSLRGRNVIIVVPRVRYGEGKWCTICNHGYAELAALDAAEDFRKAANAEVVFLVPFGAEIASAWIEATPAELEKVREWKNPPEGEQAGGKRLQRAARARRLLAMDLSAEPGRVAKPFPILLDAGRVLTGRLGVYATEWGGASAEQGIPAVYILDAQGIVRFKHVAQTSTWDRPPNRTLIDFVTALNRNQAVSEATRAAIIAASLDYVEGWYQGDAVRMRRALHPDLAKRKMKLDAGGRPSLKQSTCESLTADPKVHPLAPGERIRVEILDVDGDLATVKIVSPRFFDYAHLVLWEGQWKVLNVAWR